MIMKSFLVFFFLLSCAGVEKTETVADQDLTTKETKKRPISSSPSNQDSNWANNYYQKTFFLIKNPLLVENLKGVLDVCQSDDFYFDQNYQKEENSLPIMYKKQPLTFTTKDGFSKKVFVTKGVCRELGLYKNQSDKRLRRIRKSIDQITLMYIYNKGTFLKDITFKTEFSTVKFLVE